VARRQTLTMLAAFWLIAAGAGPAAGGPLDGDGSGYDNERLRPGIYPAAPVPEDFAVPNEPGHSPLDIDWSVGLRGSYSSQSDGEDSFVTTLSPQASGTYRGQRSTLTFTGSTDLARANGSDTIGITGAALEVSGQYALDGLTTLSGHAALGHARDLPGTPGLDPQIIRPAGETTASLGLGVTRRFGRFNLGLDGTLARTAYGDSLRRDTGLTNHDDSNFWSSNASLRLGYQATPIFEVFGAAEIGRDMFDRPSDSLGERLDATDKTLRAGVTGTWGEIVSASASMGLGQRDFDADGFSDVSTELYDASITFRPDPTLNLTAGLSTIIAPPGADAVGTARIEHSANAEIDYTVNSWLRLRASADWTRWKQVDGSERETRYGLGAGADYQVSRHTALSADYDYGHRENSASGTLDSHTISVGVTLQR